MEKNTFKKLVKEHQNRIYTFAHYYLNNREEAEDVTQDVLLRLWKHGHNIQLDAVSAWLIKVTRNACYDAIRRRKTRRTYNDSDYNQSSISQLATEEPSPCEEMESLDLQGRVESALAMIREPYRSILILREIQDLKYEHIAKSMELPLNTVKGYLHRGRKKMREHLKDWVNIES